MCYWISTEPKFPKLESPGYLNNLPGIKPVYLPSLIKPLGNQVSIASRCTFVPPNVMSGITIRKDSKK